MELERLSPSSLQEQIAVCLQREIDDGSYEPSGRLPSESELVARFGVSRVTVRLALDRLQKGGRIERRQGKGSFTTGKRIRHELDSLLSFHQALKAQGLDAAMETLSLARVPVPRELRGAFGARSRYCLQLRRLHSVSGEPVALATSLVSAALQRVDWHAAGGQPLYAILDEFMGLKVARAEISIRAQSLDPDAAAALGLPSSAPVLAMRRASFTAEGHLCDSTVFLIRSERYEFCLNSATSARLGTVGPNRP